MNIFQKIFCKHENDSIICWHWTHGQNGNEIRFLEIQKKCNNCGKIYFDYIKNWNRCEAFIKQHHDKEWSNKCKPIF